MSKAEEILIQYRLLRGQTEKDVIQAMMRYARLMIEADREKVAENAKVKLVEDSSHTAYDITVYEPVVDKESILNLPIELT